MLLGMGITLKDRQTINNFIILSIGAMLTYNISIIVLENVLEIKRRLRMCCHKKKQKKEPKKKEKKEKAKEESKGDKDQNES